MTLKHQFLTTDVQSISSLINPLTSTCQDPVQSTGDHQVLFGLEGQQLVCGDEGRSSKLSTGLVQRLGHNCLDTKKNKQKKITFLFTMTSSLTTILQSWEPRHHHNHNHYHHHHWPACCWWWWLWWLLWDCWHVTGSAPAVSAWGPAAPGAAGTALRWALHKNGDQLKKFESTMQIIKQGLLSHQVHHLKKLDTISQMMKQRFLNLMEKNKTNCQLSS